MALHYILDGYNVINKIDFFSRQKLPDARAALIHFIEVNRPHGSLRNSITIVFDGKDGVTSCGGTQEVVVVFSRGKSADEHIKEMVGNARQPRAIQVVTDDRDIAFSCRQHGATIMTVHDFIGKGRSKHNKEKKRSSIASELSYSQSKEITEELSKIWLREKK